MKILSNPNFQIFFLLFITLIHSSANSDTNCEYELEDGMKYNFAKLRKESGDYNYIFSKYTYKANFCGPLNQKCITSPNTPAGLFIRGTFSIMKEPLALLDTPKNGNQRSHIWTLY